jgi:hypothetical protein
MLKINGTKEVMTDTSGPKVMEDITCSVFSSFEELSGMQEEWDSFVESVEGDIYLTYDWCRIWWSYYGAGRELRIYIFRSTSGIVGIIPTFFEKIRILFFSLRIGEIVGSDFTLHQFCLPVHPQYIDRCAQLFLESAKTIRWHVLRIGPLAGLYTEAEALEVALRRFSNDSEKVVVGEGMVQTYFKLQPSWEEHLAHLSKGQRREIVRKYAAIEKKVPDSATNMKVIFAEEKNLNSFYKAFVDLHQAHWRRLGKLGHFGDWPSSFEFHKAMAAAQLSRGRLRLMSVELNNEALGYEYAYKFGDRYYAVLNARTEDGIYKEIGVGAILFAEQVKMAIGEKTTCIDAMRGRYDYKLRLGGELFATRSLSVIRKGSINSLRVYLFGKIARLLDFLYYRIWFQRIAPKLPFKRRPLWKLWIRTRL